MIEKLRTTVYNTLNKRLDFVDDFVLDKISYELNIIDEYNTAEYFLIYSKLTDICHEFGILTSPGRASSSASLVNYCLGITQINPLDYNLPIERFLNPLVKDFVKIDIDVEKGQRQVLLKEFEKRNPDVFVYQFLMSTNPEESLIEINDSYYKPHPCATVITSDNTILNEIPIEIDGINYLLSKPEAYNGSLYNILELDYLNKINAIYKKLGDDNLHPYKLKTNDNKVIENLYLNGGLNIFQFNNKSLNKILKTFNPTLFKDIVFLNATFRPGCLDILDEADINRDDGWEKNLYSSERVNDIFNETDGVLAYQEQIIYLISKLTGFDLQTADLYRVKLNLEKGKEYDFYKQNLLDAALENSDIDQYEIELLVDKILSYNKNSFPKTHAVSYATISYWGAWYRTYYPKEFKSVMESSLLNNVIK